MTEAWEEWMDNPLAIDQLQGHTVREDPLYVMQARQTDARWVDFNTPRQDRDEVTRIQAQYLTKDPQDTGLRVWKREVIWTLDEVPGTELGQTPPGQILARNIENTNRLLAEESQQPTE